MRLSRVYAVGVVALAATLLPGPAVHAAAAPVRPFDAFTVDGGGLVGVGRSVAFDDSNAAFSLDSSASLPLFRLAADTPAGRWQAQAAPPSGTDFAAGTYSIESEDPAPDATHAFFFLQGPSTPGCAAGTYLTVFNGAFPPPTVSSLNPAAHQTVANGVITGLSDQNTFDIFNSNGTTNVVVDVAGNFAEPGALGLQPAQPGR
ncbi:MAG: hypothetical protein J2P15_04665 [Micromonosporaceae bacterium]|nr:hypothetical protein [Micromonosporaceae bacterium]